MRAPRLIACSRDSRIKIPDPSPGTKPSRSRSNVRTGGPGSPRQTEPGAVLPGGVQARGGQPHTRGGDGHLRETGPPLRGLALDVILGIERVDLARELCDQAVRGKPLDRA